MRTRTYADDPMEWLTSEARCRGAAIRAKRWFFLSCLGLLVIMLSGCNALDRVADVGAAPRLAAVQDPSFIPASAPVRMPMPLPSYNERQANSLWQTGARAFFRDQRASRVGDILTIVIALDEKAELENESTRSRTNSDTANLDSIYGFESKLKGWFPDAVNPTSLVDMGSSTSNNGRGSVDRSEKINLRVAATITQVLPNGNLVLGGRQQINVNFEQRELTVSGVIRPEDISSENTVSYDQIAEARISYGGRGQIQDVQQPRYGSQVFDIIMPF